MGAGEIVDKTKREEITFRILAVIIALFLWMYVTRVDNPQTQIEIDGIPVTIVNEDALAQSGLILVKDKSDYTINLTIGGSTKDVNSVKPSDFRVEANMANGYFRKGTNSVLVEIKDWPKNIDIPKQPFYINVYMDELVKKSFPVTLQANIDTKAGYAAVLPGAMKPNEVVIQGASSDIGSVNTVVASISAVDATSDVVKSVPVVALDKNGATINGLTITPSTIDVSIPVKRAKDVPVNVKQSGKLPGGVYLKSIAASPGKVTIVGDEKTLNGIKSIDTEPVSLSDVTASTTKVAKLVLPGGVTLANNAGTDINVNITVESSTSKTFGVPVTTVNLPDGLTAALSSNTINVTLTGQESALNGVSAADIKAVVDLSSASEGEGDYTPKVTAPSGFSIDAVDPAKIKITISKTQG